MFHVYFGAFDWMAYAIAGIFAIVLSGAICSEMDEQEQARAVEQKKVSPTQSVEQPLEAPLILDAQIFELRGTLVVKKEDLAIALPDEIKALSLRGDPVIRLIDLCQVYGTVAIEAEQVIRKWEQWSQQQQKKKPKPKQRNPEPIEEVARLNGGGGFGHGTPSALTV